jgi:hypothetical protein
MGRIQVFWQNIYNVEFHTVILAAWPKFNYTSNVLYEEDAVVMYHCIQPEINTLHFTV